MIFVTSDGSSNDLTYFRQTCRLNRHLKSPVTVEEEIVHDANYVELLGAFGIAKAFTKGGAEGQSYEETADIFEHQFLDAVEFRTPVGNRMAAEKRAYTKDFFARLRAELCCTSGVGPFRWSPPCTGSSQRLYTLKRQVCRERLFAA